LVVSKLPFARSDLSLKKPNAFPWMSFVPDFVTIESAPLEVLKNPEGKEQHKTVLYFKGAKKALPLNVSNWDAVAEICGEDTDDWSGGKIELYATKTHMGGKVVDCIRVRANG